MWKIHSVANPFQKLYQIHLYKLSEKKIILEQITVKTSLVSKNTVDL